MSIVAIVLAVLVLVIIPGSRRGEVKNTVGRIFVYLALFFAVLSLLE